MIDATLWRAFPWHRRAREGEPFSPSFVPRVTGRGRFDLPMGTSPVLYLAQTPEHAAAEVIQPWRGQTVDARHLQRAGHPLALVPIHVSAPADTIANLCDPSALVDLPAAPDRLASRHRSITQPLARAVWDAGRAGLRWWSSFWGDWHTVVLFTARLPEEVRATYGQPDPLTLGAPAMVEAARLLGIELRS